MKNETEEELKKTKSLNDLTDLIAKETEDYYPTIDGDKEENQVKEDNILDDTSTKEEVFNHLTSNLHIDTEKLEKETIIDKFKKLDKKKKIIVLSLIGVVLVLIIGLVVYLLLPKDNKTSEELEEKESIVIDNGNYTYIDGILHFLSEGGAEIGTYECNNKNEEQCYVSFLSNYEDQFDQNNSLYEDNSIVKFRSNIYNNRYVFINDNSDEETDIILYDILENNIVNRYLNIKSYKVKDINYVVLKDNNNMYGLYTINDNGMNNILGTDYNYIGITNKEDDKILVRNSKGYYLIDYSNKKLTDYYSDTIFDYNDTYLVTKGKNGYTIYNDNEDLILENANFIRIVDEYFLLVKDNALYIRDNENCKYNEVGIQLYNDNYIVNNIYSEDGLLTKSDYAFKVNYDENANKMFTFIKTGNEVLEDYIMLSDGAISKYLPYFSYFNGVLNIYDNEEKTDLIGSYTCSNKNNLEDNDVHCFLYIDQLFDDNFKNSGKGFTGNFLPIIGNRFAFIVDTLDIENYPDIKLYDLRDNKTIATYSEVSANVYDSDSLVFLDRKDDIIVKTTAKNGSKYGKISLSANGLVKKYDFIYDLMENIGEFTLVKQNGRYMLLYNDGTVSASYEYKIVDYNSNRDVVVQDGDKYKLYDRKGERVTPDGESYKMIKMLSNKYYAYIDDNNKLIVKDFNNNVLSSTDGETFTFDNEENNRNYYNRYSLSEVGDSVLVNVYNESGVRMDSKTFIRNSNGGNTDEAEE